MHLLFVSVYSWWQTLTLPARPPVIQLLLDHQVGIKLGMKLLLVHVEPNRLVIEPLHVHVEPNRLVVRRVRMPMPKMVVVTMQIRRVRMPMPMMVVAGAMQIAHSAAMHWISHVAARPSA